MGGGHYIAHATHTQSAPATDVPWQRFDDSHVSDAAQSDIVSPSAYVLFFRRSDTIDPADEAAAEQRERTVERPVDEDADEEDAAAAAAGDDDGATALDVDEATGTLSDDEAVDVPLAPLVADDDSEPNAYDD
eukprot:TRINITY_DN1824_c0_g1_i2.p3 TRINITY_DN1824_c0_g1~~TRINITY_DN1824_c0_g1_i2.p3  ORF type:complete len:133 (+),score=107.54 TRINITY_DN1824_c0_g1_i2:182-580(+)